MACHNADDRCSPRKAWVSLKTRLHEGLASIGMFCQWNPCLACRKEESHTRGGGGDNTQTSSAYTDSIIHCCNTFSWTLHSPSRQHLIFPVSHPCSNPAKPCLSSESWQGQAQPITPHPTGFTQSNHGHLLVERTPLLQVKLWNHRVHKDSCHFRVPLQMVNMRWGCKALIVCSALRDALV